MDNLVIPLVVVGLLVLLGGAFVMLRRKPKEKEEQFFHYHCPGCKRKFRYRATQVGHRAKCPQCNKEWVFPPPAASARPR